MDGRMNTARAAATGLVASAVLAVAGVADTACGVQEELTSLTFSGEAYGSNRFEYPLSDALTFVLEPAEFGWDVHVRAADGSDLSTITPPIRTPDVNPRAIAGWHFRNLDNTGANAGEVNAPQAHRRFVFGPDALDAEIRAALDPQPRETAAPRYGRGELTILDYGLADLDEGERAHMVYLRFEACLEWSALEPPDAGNLETYSGIFRFAFEESSFLTLDGRGPWWTSAAEPSWNELREHQRTPGGRGYAITVALSVEGRLETGGEGYGHLGAYDGRLHIERITALRPLEEDEYAQMYSQILSAAPDGR